MLALPLHHKLTQREYVLNHTIEPTTIEYNTYGPLEEDTHTG